MSTIVKGECSEYWQQKVHYTIDIKLLPRTRIIEGQEQILYHNNSPDTLTSLYFHLYPNAFKKGSIMAQEASEASIKLITSPEHHSFMNVDIVAIYSDTKVNQEINFTESYNSDSTLLKLELEKKIRPAQSVKLFIKFKTKIHQYNPHYDVGGYRKGIFQVNQWYPKLCVYDKNGWNATPYHYLGEFYGEFGNYEVTIQLPDSFIVAATGEIIDGDAGWNAAKEKNKDETGISARWLNHKETKDDDHGMRQVTFYAEKVHDFVWLASANYLYEHDDWEGVPLHIFYLKSSENTWKASALNAAKQALSWWGKTIGEYPYPQLTVCEGVVDGGMEYPMLTTLGYFDLLLTVHEIGHMYFYGALANNEQKDGWFDEGIVTYHTELFKESTYPGHQDTLIPQITINGLKNQFRPFSRHLDVRLNSLYYYFYSGFEKPLRTDCYKLKNPHLYSYNVYVKSSKFFSLLDYIVGRENYYKILSTFYERYKFQHVQIDSFVKVSNEIAQQNLTSYFNQWIYGTPKIDYCWSDITSRITNKSWENKITIERLGDGIIPIETELTTNSGEKIVKTLNEKSSKYTFSIVTDSKVKDVKIDPRDIILDQNRLNNSTLKIKTFLYPDFPTMYYLPRNNYSLFLWPQAWYNDIDGVKVGLKLTGGYLNRYYITRSYLFYNFKSREIDFKFGYSMPWEEVDRNLWRHVQIIKFEGRRLINANINYNIVESFARQPAHSLRLGFLNTKIIDDRYGYREVSANGETKRILEWDSGTLSQLYFHYFMNRNNSFPPYKLKVWMYNSNKLWGSKFDYSRIALQFNTEIKKICTDLTLKLRGFSGAILANDTGVPVQDLFWVAEANPLDRYKNYYFRSIRSLPVWLKYHVPGDGNLRGYLHKLVDDDKPLTANRIFSSSFDLVRSNVHKMLPKILHQEKLGVDLYFFLDGGWIYTDDNNSYTLFDGGIGFDFKKKILGKLRRLRLSFPIWLSQPNLRHLDQNEPEWEFRWFIRIQ